MAEAKEYFFARYKGAKACLICGSRENLVVNLNRKIIALELVPCEKCIDLYKAALKKNFSNQNTIRSL